MNQKGIGIKWIEVILLVVVLFISLYFIFKEEKLKEAGKKALEEKIQEVDSVIAAGVIDKLSEKKPLATLHDEFTLREEKPIIYYGLMNNENKEGKFSVLVLDEEKNPADALYESEIILAPKKSEVFAVAVPVKKGYNSYYIVVYKEGKPYASVVFHANFKSAE